MADESVWNRLGVPYVVPFEELDKLNELLKSGALTQEEFEKAKKKILDN